MSHQLLWWCLFFVCILIGFVSIVFQPPTHLCVQGVPQSLFCFVPQGVPSKADNTVREAKNQYLMSFLNVLVGKYFLKSASLCHLRKSHTHCRIGAPAVFLVKR